MEDVSSYVTLENNVEKNQTADRTSRKNCHFQK